MKQLNHSPEAAAAVLGLSLERVQYRLAGLRKYEPRFNTQAVAPDAYRKILSHKVAPKTFSTFPVATPRESHDF
jgi:hypothetical protein